MRYFPHVVVLFAAAAVWLAFAGAPPPAVDVFADQSIAVANITRQYTLVVPHAIAQHPPLIFAFHGTGDTTQSMAAYSQLNSLAAEHGFVLVYPAAAGSYWDTSPVSSGKNNPDLFFFDSLLTHLVAQRNVDARRVYAIGMSNGATFVQLLAACRSLQVAAVVAHSGTPPAPSDPSPERTSPTLLIVGDLDPVHDSVVHYATEHDLPYISVSGLAHQWSAHHNTDMWRFLSQFTTPAK